MKFSFLNIHDLVLILAVAECLLLAFFLKTLPSKRKQSRRLLAIFFIFMAGWILATLLIWNKDLQTLFINTTFFPPILLTICILLQGPCLYFYLRSLSENVQWRNGFLLIHLIPVVLVLATILIFHLDGLAWLPWTEMAPYKKIAVKFCWAVTRCSPLLYVIACMYVEHKLRKQYQHVYSTISAVDIKLADCVLLGFFVHWLWGCIGYFIGGYISPFANDWMGIADNYLIVLQVNGWFVLGLINTRELLNLTDVMPVPARSTEKTEPTITEEKILLLEQAISIRRIYLENNINLDRFAELAGLKAKDVSTILNHRYKINFFEFINGLRVEEAKRLLASADSAHLSILEIVYQSGFNSQSSFQRFFKRSVECSPSEYRRLALIGKKGLHQ